MRKPTASVFTFALLLVCMVPQLHAMPQFARKYGVTCNTCHTTIPRLNEFGYNFRAAGFRMPDDIGKSSDDKFNLGDYLGARLQARYDTQVTNQPNGAPVANVIGGVAGTRTTNNSLSFQEFTLYPLTGSWGKYFGTLAELSVSPEDVFEIENAYVRVVFGSAKKFFTSRFGVFHPWEGIGASDRPFSNARPLFQTSGLATSGRGVPYVFQPWGLDEAGAEFGADVNRFSVRAAVLNGTLMRWEEEANAFLPFPAQTGPWKGANQAPAALTKQFNAVAHNTPDFSASATYILNSDGGGISVHYYRGNIATPTHCTDGTAIGTTNATTGQVCGATGASVTDPYGTTGNVDFDYTAAGGAFRNDFDRAAAYLAYPVLKGKLHPQIGYQLGRDTKADGSKFDSRGLFAEGSYIFSQYLTAGMRYDYFRPNASVLNNQQWAVTPYVSVPLQNGFQIIAEYQHRDFKLNATNHRQNDTLQARIIFIK